MRPWFGWWEPPEARWSPAAGPPAGVGKEGILGEQVVRRPAVRRTGPPSGETWGIERVAGRGRTLIASPACRGGQFAAGTAVLAPLVGRVREGLRRGRGFPAGRTMMTEQTDVIVVGLGPAGEDVAGRLAEAGLQVIGIEQALVGGECPYWGCVPSKMMIRAGHSLAEANRVARLAGTATVDADWTPVMQRIRDEATDDWDDTVAVQRLLGKGVRFVRGRARMTAPRTVLVDAQSFQASRGVVIAIGTQPWIPPIHGLAEVPYWTNREAIEAKEVPGSLTVLGGGAVGLELAQVFARFGAKVTVLEATPRLLPGEEPEAGELLADVLAADGIRVITNTDIRRVCHHGGAFSIELNNQPPVGSERLLVATGRRPDLTGLGAGAAGINHSARFIAVDEHLRAAEGVWAVGDVTGTGLFTHVAVYQARIAAADITGQPHEAADYRALPRVTFTDPEIGAVGLTEAHARDQRIAVRTASAAISSSARGWIHKIGNEGSSNWSKTPLVASWSGRPRLGRPVGRCWARSRSPYTLRYRWISWPR